MKKHAACTEFAIFLPQLLTGRMTLMVTSFSGLSGKRKGKQDGKKIKRHEGRDPGR